MTWHVVDRLTHSRDAGHPTQAQALLALADLHVQVDDDRPGRYDIEEHPNEESEAA